MKILQRNLEYVRCVRNEEECVCSVCMFRCNIFTGVRIIKEMPGSVASGTSCIMKYAFIILLIAKYVLLIKNVKICSIHVQYPHAVYPRNVPTLAQSV
jgi:hypothetical protein